MAFALLLALPSQEALAKDYTLKSTNITATINSDTSMTVTQERTVSFDGRFSLLMVPLGDSATFDISSITVQKSGYAAEALDQVVFETSWRDYGGPDTASFAVDSNDGTVYIFDNYNDGDYTVTLNYTYANAINVYSDTAELYWKFVSEAWQKDSGDVTCTVTVPVPAGVTPNLDVRAWAHGPLNGHVENEQSKITYTVGSVSAGKYAEARILFPTSWITTYDATAQASNLTQEMLPTILAEEEKFANDANAERIRSMVGLGVLVAIPIIFIIAFIVMFFKYGKEYDLDFKGEYWRDAPDAEWHPIVISRNERFGKESASDLIASIMHLHALGVIQIESTRVVTKRKIRRDKIDTSFIITMGKPKNQKLTDIDLETLKFLFEEVPTSNKKIGDVDAFAGNPAEQTVTEYVSETYNDEYATHDDEFASSISSFVSDIKNVPAGVTVDPQLPSEEAINPFEKYKGKSLKFNDIKDWFESDGTSARLVFDNWQNVVTLATDDANLFDEKSAKVAGVFSTISSVCLGLMVAALVALVALGNILGDIADELFVFLIGGLVVMVVVAILARKFSHALERRTRRANEAHAKTKALKKWLCDFTALGERPAADSLVWGEFMVYAYILGVAKEAIEQLQIAYPSVMSDPTTEEDEVAIMPWWFWYHDPYDGGGGQMFADGLTSIEDCFSRATQALESGIGGDFSSGSGFDSGGFSAGGGGGFGGGGIGGAR
ncbi:MAG: DUF2207 domain-containing protein [Phoenicibacter congonensis]|uniref:DUF2207 domain-containing protein n=1 Tax=Phoenicibacter congonensis TaxID=1944646 RepID=A0AA43RIF4_9ACTN|nr:DUF2207 domain-containing protein [Phoenicibacter congonensis]